MPILLEPRDVISDLEGADSVLIVSCSMCPPMNLAMQTGTPVIQPLSHGLKTPAYEEYVESTRALLEQRGMRTDVFTSLLPTPLMCVWTDGQRARLRKKASGFDAVLVMGCSSALRTAQDALEDMDCSVVLGMRMRGVASGKLRFERPLTVSIEPVPKRGSRREPPAAAPCDQPCEADLDSQD